MTTNAYETGNPLAGRNFSVLTKFADWKARFEAETSTEGCIGLLYGLSQHHFSWQGDDYYPGKDVLPYLLDLSEGHACAASFRRGGNAFIAEQKVAKRAFKVLVERFFREENNPDTMYQSPMGFLTRDTMTIARVFRFLDGDTHLPAHERNISGGGFAHDLRLLRVLHVGIGRFAEVLWDRGNAPDGESFRVYRPRLVPIMARISVQAGPGDLPPGNGLDFFLGSCDEPTLAALTKHALAEVQASYKGKDSPWPAPSTIEEACTDSHAARVALAARYRIAELERRMTYVQACAKAQHSR